MSLLDADILICFGFPDYNISRVVRLNVTHNTVKKRAPNARGKNHSTRINGLEGTPKSLLFWNFTVVKLYQFWEKWFWAPDVFSSVMFQKMLTLEVTSSASWWVEWFSPCMLHSCFVTKFNCGIFNIWFSSNPKVDQFWHLEIS